MSRADSTCLGFPMEEPGDTVAARFMTRRGCEIDEILNDGGRIPREPEKNTASVAAKAMLDDARRNTAASR